MDRKLFIEKMNELKDQREKNFTIEDVKKIVVEAIDFLDNKDKEHPVRIRGERNLYITLEEFSELSKEITKVLRGRVKIDEPIGVLEELADVCYNIILIKEIFDISDEELMDALHVKMDRLKEGMQLPDFC